MGSPAGVGDLSGLRAGKDFAMVDGGAYDPDKCPSQRARVPMIVAVSASDRRLKVHLRPLARTGHIRTQSSATCSSWLRPAAGLHLWA